MRLVVAALFSLCLSASSILTEARDRRVPRDRGGQHEQRQRQRQRQRQQHQNHQQNHHPPARRRPARANGGGRRQQVDLGDLGGLGDLFGALAGAAQQKEDGTCPSACDNDDDNNNKQQQHPHYKHYFPVPKKRIRPYSNGCSVPESMREGLGDYSMFVPCCDLHDACYFSCGVPKPMCEDEFGKCMKKQCQATKKTKREREECEQLAALFTMGTTIFGCGGYTELQKEGCDCLPQDQAVHRVREYAHEFYAAFNQTHTLPDRFLNKYLQHEDEAHTNRQKRISKQGEMIFKLYKKYPKSIELISRDGKSGRKRATYFQPATAHHLNSEPEL